MEAQIFEQDDIAGLGLRTSGFDFRADAVVEKLHRFTEQFFQRGSHGLEGKFLDAFAIGTAEMAHQANGRASS